MRQVALSGGAALLFAALAGAVPAHASAVRAPSGTQRARVQAAATLPRGASVTGPVAAPTSVQVTISLTPADPQGLQSYASDVSDPGSSLYRDYLSVGQFAARFGASSSEVSSVRSALSQAGLSAGAVSANGLSLTASGTASEVEDAFDTQLSRVTLPGGDTAYADTMTPTLPSAAAQSVEAVTGLSTLPVASPQDLRRADHSRSDLQTTQVGANTAGPSTCAEESAAGGYTAQDIGSAYGLTGLWDGGDVGANTTVALVELEPYTASDVSHYQNCDGTSATIVKDSLKVGGQSVSCNGDSNCGLEDVLDIEDVAGLVPDASIEVYEAPNTDQGLLAVYQAIVQSDAAVVSTSWGECEADAGSSLLNEENTLFEEAATEGKAVFAASGDQGADDCQTTDSDPQVRAVDDPSSQPYVTGVGGTTMASDAQGSTETVWNDSDGAGGGGVSRDWSVPSWQSADAVTQSTDAVGGATLTCTATPGSSTTSTSCREVPDVTADADPATGYDVYWDGSWNLVGGTSAAAPTWAALVALADGSDGCTAHSVRVGFANPLLYALPSSDFYDVSSGNNTYSGTLGYKALSGYDMASGLGAPDDGTALAAALCSASTTTSTTTTTINTTTTTPTPATTTQTVTEPAPVQTTTAPGPTGTPTTATTSSPGGAVDAVRFLKRPRRRTVRLGSRVRLLLRARDRAGLRLRYSARRLPRGLRIDRRTGVITGRPTRLGRRVSSITARDPRGDAQTIVIRWVVRRG